MQNSNSLDIAIFGAGIAGLWLLNLCRQAGYNAALFEKDTIGGVQTIHAQGIIHGGMKYNLLGKLTQAGTNLQAIPTFWHNCLQGQGELDLSATTLLSSKQYMFSNASAISKLSNFFSSKLLHTAINKINKENYPKALQNSDFKGLVYELPELVLDVPSLIKTLAKPYLNNIYKFQVEDFASLQKTIQAKHYIFTTGADTTLLPITAPKIQLRPLNMVWVRNTTPLPTLYAHYIGLDTVPLLTITTHFDNSGNSIWYLGGKLAETGVNLTYDAQIATTYKLLIDTFPWLDLSGAEIHTLPLQRAEAATKTGTRPDSFFSYTQDNYSVAWPTKLALAPLMARDIMTQIKHITPSYQNNNLAYPCPNYRQLPWNNHAIL